MKKFFEKRENGRYPEIENFPWPDASLEKIEIGYEDVFVTVLRFDDASYRIQCGGFIAVDYVGQWDENIIREVKIVGDSPLIRRALREVDERNHVAEKWDGGGAGVRARKGNWAELQIYLIDGLCVRIVAQSFRLFLLAEEKEESA